MSTERWALIVAAVLALAACAFAVQSVWLARGGR
jgi:hypothetical protein